ncbi:DUF2637 domain-containing protein [Micromonospora sp. WMMD956]|uniref:DUF2637 domain-containing protein n=1 Tax=Micromonospora sp. WMMD956 TaxID=3016108 RepID=UPI002416CEA5|nr:DUF2637 domain-containing protein [Micromonospora sp. WMMD956]MDG4815175.1 DUF2637 domain-containing protein [Micromonospora sp. WMMD956]
MTAPTINGTRYPQPVDELLPAARDLPLPAGQQFPSRNRLMREFRIGAAKADDLLARLKSEHADRTRAETLRTAMVVRGALLTPATAADESAVPRLDYPEPIGPDPAPVPIVAEQTTPTAPAPAVAVDSAPVEQVEQVTVVSHPGTKISPDRHGKRAQGRGWAYVGVILGGVVSIAANVAHTYLPKPPDGAPAGWAPAPGWSPSPLAVALSVFWPVALFVAVEILTRIPWGEGVSSVVARVAGVLPVAVVAAVVSYRHLSGLLEHFGEDPLTIAIGPLAVDGLMVMASAALLVTNRRSRT